MTSIPSEIQAALSGSAKPPVQYDTLPPAFREGFEIYEPGPDKLVLRHREGGFLIGELAHGAVQTWTVHEGEAAHTVLDQQMFHINDALKAGALQILAEGTQADAGLEEMFGTQQHIRELARTLRPDGGEERTLQVLPTCPVLRILTHPDGTVREASWLEGSAAEEEVETTKALLTGLESTREVGVYRARTVTEALSHAQLRGLKVRLARRVPQSRRLEVWGVLHTHPTRMIYAIDTWTGGWSAGSLGEGTSHLIDPVGWVLWANRLGERAGEATARAALDLELAADALEQALRFIPEGQALPPLGIYGSKVTENIRKNTPEVVDRMHLTSEIVALRSRAAQEEN